MATIDKLNPGSKNQEAAPRNDTSVVPATATSKSMNARKSRMRMIPFRSVERAIGSLDSFLIPQPTKVEVMEGALRACEPTFVMRHKRTRVIEYEMDDEDAGKIESASRVRRP
jgi:hypothetical protein